MRANSYSLTFKINQRKTPDRYLKPIALFVDPTLQTGAPYLGSGEVAYTPFRKRAIVPSSCLMYKVVKKDNGDEDIHIINIKGLPYDFIRLILHSDYDYRNGDNLKYLIDMRLYNDRLRAFTQSSIQTVTTTDQPNCENVYYLLDHAAQFIKDKFTNITTIEEINEEIRRYRVVFLYDNVDDYNSYLFIRQLILNPGNSEKWAILALHKKPSNNNLDPFRNILHFTINNSIPPNYTDVFKSANLWNQPVSDYVELLSVDKVYLRYKIIDGLTTFTENSLGKLKDNIYFFNSNSNSINQFHNDYDFATNFLNSIIFYLDYNKKKNDDGPSNHDDLRIVGFGFITQDVGANIEERVSALDVLKGRDSVTNTDGILYEHATLTAFLRFIVLYKYLGYDILCYATYNENTKEFKNIKTVDYLQKSRIYHSNDISQAKNTIEQKEDDGFIILKRNNKIFISYNDDNQNSIELQFDTIYQLESIISSLSNERIRLVYANNSIKDVIEKYFTINTNSKIVFTLNRYPTYRHDPMYVTDNSGSLGNPNYVEFLSDYYPLYWYYDGNVRVPDIGTTSISVADKYFYNLHPCVLIYGNAVRYPDTKRHVRARLVKHLISVSPGSNPAEYDYSGVTYIEIQDPVQLVPSIWVRLLDTQSNARLPLDLNSLTHNSFEVAPPVINLDYMTTPIRNFINANLISSRDILEYPMMPNSNTPSEIEPTLKVYYREVLYWKYLRYLINAGIVRYYFYNRRSWAAPDIVDYGVRRLNSDSGLPTTEITLRVPFYDNRIIDAIEIEINIVA